MIEYKERRRIVDEIKDELQTKITEYSKIVETGVFLLFIVHESTLQFRKVLHFLISALIILI